MTDLRNVLIPVSGNHSIKEAVITLFLGSPIMNPETYESLLKDGFNGRYQKFGKVNQLQFQLVGKEEGGIESKSPQLLENIGFRFQKFKDGNLIEALQGVNEQLRNFISFHSLNYNDWDIFFPEFRSVLNTISDFQKNLKVKAFSLHYIDEFSWNDNSDINVDLVFNKQSELLPVEFFNCKLNNYQITKFKDNKFSYIDRLEIKIDDSQQKSITVSHNLISELESVVELNELINSTNFEEKLNHAHSINKQVLISLLKKDVCELINLKN